MASSPNTLKPKFSESLHCFSPLPSPLTASLNVGASGFPPALSLDAPITSNALNDSRHFSHATPSCTTTVTSDSPKSISISISSPSSSSLSSTESMSPPPSQFSTFSISTANSCEVDAKVDALILFLKREYSLPETVDYLHRTKVDMTIADRIAVIGYMYESAKSSDWNLHPETLHAAIAYFDRFLSTTTINRHYLQLIAVVSLLIATKMNEETHPSLSHVANNLCRRKYSVTLLRDVESLMLKQFQWRTYQPTAQTALSHLINVYPSKSQLFSTVITTAAEIVECSYVDYMFVLCRPSLLALCSLLAAFDTLYASEEGNAWLQSVSLFSHFFHEETVQSLRSILKDFYLERCQNAAVGKISSSSSSPSDDTTRISIDLSGSDDENEAAMADAYASDCKQAIKGKRRIQDSDYDSVKRPKLRTVTSV